MPKNAQTTAWLHSFHTLASESCSVVSNSLQPHGLQSPWNSPGQNTGVGLLSLLQGIFPTQGSNLGLPRCRWILYQLSHKGSPRILEWVAYRSSSGSSQPRKWAGVSCISGGFFTNWAIREALAIHQPRLQQFVNWELPDVQAGFRKGRGTRDQFANTLLDHWKS